MKIGFVGLPGSGKTTCFRLLTGHQGADTHRGATVATVSIPDPRLDRVAELAGAKKRTYADVTFVDFEALHKGDASRGELALHKVSGDVDAFALVLQCFGQIDSRGEALHAESDLETIMLEMALNDLKIIEKHIEHLEKGPKGDRSPQRMEFVHRCRDQLSGGGALRQLRLSDEERKYLAGFRPLTLMPTLVVCNVGEEDLRGAGTAGACQVAAAMGLPSLHLCAELELEIAQLSPQEQQEFLSDYGLQVSAHDRLLQACFELLEQITFFTCNESEARAWTIRRGATAPQAAGKVHSDMQAGFIRAEVTPFTWLEKLGSLQVCKERGYTRVEGKEYVVQEGDILQIRFSR